MSITFTYPNDDDLSLHKGLPESYSGHLLAGARCWHAVETFGTIVVQEYRTDGMYVSYVVIDWQQPQRLLCEYDFTPGIFSRTVISGSVYEAIKGSGKIYLQGEEFFALAGSTWTGIINTAKRGQHAFINMWLSADGFMMPLHGLATEAAHIDKQFEGLPFMLATTAQALSPHQKSILRSILNMSLGASDEEEMRIVNRFFAVSLEEIKHEGSFRRTLGEMVLFTILKAKKLIDYNLDQQYSTIEISVKVGTSDFQLKKFFPRLTGYKVAEYRRFKLFTRAGRTIMQRPDEPLKTVSVNAGYSSLGTFIRAYRNICHCTPGELRSPRWDVSKIAIKIPAYDEA